MVVRPRRVHSSSRFGFYDAFNILGREGLIVVVDLGFTMLLKSQAICVAFYSEHEKSNKFCSEALISAWGSFTWRKSTTRDPQLCFTSPPKEVILRIFTLGKNPSSPAGRRARKGLETVQEDYKALYRFFKGRWAQLFLIWQHYILCSVLNTPIYIVYMYFSAL